MRLRDAVLAAWVLAIPVYALFPWRRPGSQLERLQSPLARAYLRRQNARALARLKAILEAAATA